MERRAVAVLVLALFLTGCAGSSKYMMDAPAGTTSYAPEDGMAALVFMRPSGFGAGVQSSVFEISSGEPHFIGIVSAKTKIAYNVDPGEHRFMVVGESGDFMDADLLAGKTYYAVVTPRMGLWKARFSLKPVHSNELSNTEFDGWYNDCRWVENTPLSHQWAQDNMASIKRKQADYLPEWLEKADKPILLPDDGQ